jgi:hypothetical protein
MFVGGFMGKEGVNAVTETFSGDVAKQETIIRRIAVKGTTIQKMRKISSLFGDEMPTDAKEADMIAFFLDLSFESFLRSGEIEKRLKSLTGEN